MRDPEARVERAGLATLFDEGAPVAHLFGERGDPEAWRTRNRLVGSRRVCAGLFVKGKWTFVASDVLAAVLALRRWRALGATARDAVKRLGRVGAMSTLDLRRSLRMDAAGFARVYRELNAAFALAQVGCDHRETDSAIVDRIDRAFPAASREARRLSRGEALSRLRVRLPAATERFLAALSGGRMRPFTEEPDA